MLQARRFFTNEENNTLLEKFEGIFGHMNIYFFDALPGFFRAPGYFRIYPFIKMFIKSEFLSVCEILKLP
jgi:hypothetical protein